MNRFEGLDLVGLLRLLHDIVLPEPPSLLPQTSGWWVISAWLVAVVLIGVAQWIAWRRRNRYRREAIAELETIAARAASEPAASAAAIASLIKRTALVVYPRETVASLHGHRWAAFLCSSASDDPVVEACADRLASAAYRADIDGGALVEGARRWIRVHHA
ncbi:MAG: DUF4381 domain-containing protein [Gammaproteobacteria bacterium]|jgi:hypothetical protein